MQKTITIDGHKVKIWRQDQDGFAVQWLNPILIKQQKLNAISVSTILKLHTKKDKLLQKMQRLDPDEDIDTLRTLAKAVMANEYALQKAWGFRKDRSYHKFWMLPHCQCPVLDNEDQYPFGPYYVNENCIYHSHKRKIS